MGTTDVKITENSDEQVQNEIWNNLRNCLNPLELTFGEVLVPVFMNTSYMEQVVQVGKLLSKEGILMPLVRVRDDLQLSQREFMILSYKKILYREILPIHGEEPCKYIMVCLEKTVRNKYADILNRDLVEEMVDNLQKKYPALISETVPSRISYGFLTAALRQFISRGNSCIYLTKLIEIMDDVLRRKKTASPEKMVTALVRQLSPEENE